MFHSVHAVLSEAHNLWPRTSFRFFSHINEYLTSSQTFLHLKHTTRSPWSVSLKRAVFFKHQSSSAALNIFILPRSTACVWCPGSLIKVHTLPKKTNTFALPHTSPLDSLLRFRSCSNHLCFAFSLATLAAGLSALSQLLAAAAAAVSKER